MTTKPTILDKEPAGTIGTTASGIMWAIFLILSGSGVDVAENLSSGVTALVLIIISIPAITGWLTRFFVVAPDTARQATETAAATGVPVDPMKGLDPMQPNTWTV